MRICLLASGDFAVPTLRSLADPRRADHQIVAVVTQPDRGSGRGRQAKSTPAKAQALELGLEVITAEDVNAPEIRARLAALDADLGLVIAFGQKIGPDARALFRHHCVNLHASLLPKYRGAAPYQWAILNGDERTGVTVFRLVDRMDAGPIYTTRWTAIKPEERAAELHDRLAQIGVDAVNATLDLLDRDPPFEPLPQDEAQATRAPKLKKKDGRLRFDLPAKVLANRINGLWSWPGAKCQYMAQADAASANPPENAARTTPRPTHGKAEPVTLALARVGDEATPNLPPGTLDYRCYVATSRGYLEILEVRPDGSRTMPFRDFVNGRHVQPGDHFTALSE